MYIYGSIPYFECLVRAEYTRNHKGGHGEYLPAVAHAVRCVRGHSLWFQVIFTEQHGGAAFLLPIEALVTKPCERAPTSAVQPWDVSSSRFGVSEDAFTARGVVDVLPDRARGQYRFTLDFVGTDLAEHPEQHKALHLVFLESGQIGAYPNNRLRWHDPAFWTVSTERPPFESLGGEYRAEGLPSTSNIAACALCCDRGYLRIPKAFCGEVIDPCQCPAGRRFEATRRTTT